MFFISGVFFVFPFFFAPVWNTTHGIGWYSFLQIYIFSFNFQKENLGNKRKYYQDFPYLCN